MTTINTINMILEDTDGPEVIVARSGKSMKVTWSDGETYRTKIPGELRDQILDALATPNEEFGRYNTRNKEWALFAIGAI